jgi:uncharacterized protein YprB with RNaseH-like and TPR domain
MGKFDKYFQEEDTAKPVRRAEPPQARVTGLPNGLWVDDGVYRVESSYRFGGRHGRKILDRAEDMEIMRIFGACGSVVFLDIETTGLTGGAGTYAFLCGIGVACGECFRVIQFFLEGPSRESRWLRAVESVIPADACLVTYNGKAFDIPLLRTRHILVRKEPSWGALPHIDLLHYARWFYKGALESCSLGSMERSVLGVERGGADIPGYLIPPMYLQYLQTKDALPLRGVFYHNEIDIVSLAALYCHIARALSGASEDGRLLLRAGDLWLSRGFPERADRLWSAAIENSLSRADAWVRKALMTKRSADYEAAREHLLSALDTVMAGESPRGESTLFVILEELAKLEEHRFKSPDRAMGYVRSALDWLVKNRYLLGRSFSEMHRSMTHRAARLEKKSKKHTHNFKSA